MKTIYKVWMALCLMCVSVLSACITNDWKSDVIGKWEVGISYFPGARQSFILDIKEKDGAIVFDVQSGELDIKEMRFMEKNNKLYANLYTGEFVTLSIWKEADEYKAAIQMSLGEIPMTLKRIE